MKAQMTLSNERLKALDISLVLIEREINAITN